MRFFDNSTFEIRKISYVISSILIPTDFSPASWKATKVGLELSRLNKNVTLSILHVYPVSKRSKKIGDSQSLLQDVKERMNKLTKDLTDHSEEIIKNVVLSGDVEDTLLTFIKEHSFDLVIVGVNSNGLNNEIGSHTVSMIEKSGIPILIVPNNPSPHGAIAS